MKELEALLQLRYEEHRIIRLEIDAIRTTILLIKQYKPRTKKKVS